MEGRPLRFEPHDCFACGSLNVGGLQLVLHVEGAACWTELELPARFQGWEGIAHGGIVCTIRDEVMAWALVGQDAWGLTARMTVEFKRPVRVGTRLRAEGRLGSARRRLLTTSARLVDADTGDLLATAEALYVAAPPDRKRELKRRYGFDEREPLLPTGGSDGTSTPTAQEGTDPAGGQAGGRT
ncbi:MAG TPA: PaaI family thioesterase [Candidatus Dormibacteraeota bacterium]|nr:PaaI family thioesterase [Candidatus Dormibacteraeota bacterium]